MFQNLIHFIFKSAIVYLSYEWKPYSMFQEAANDITDTEEAIERMKKLSSKLAVHYCENEKSFKIDEFLDAFRDFCEKVKTCEQDIETWRVNAEKAEQRRKTQAELVERRKSKCTVTNFGMMQS